MVQSAQSIPPLFGGYPLPVDLVPSIISASLYFLLVLLFIYRYCRKSTRTYVLNGIFGFAIERSITFGLRVVVTVVPPSEDNLTDLEGLLEYLQTAIFMAMLPIAQDLAMLIRTLLVNATYGSEKAKEIPYLQEYLQHPNPSDTESITKTLKGDWKGDDASTANTLFAKSEWSFSGTTAVIQHDDEGLYADQPRLRFWFRRMHDGIVFSFFAVLAIGTAGSCLIIVQRGDPVKTRRNQILRYVAVALSVVTIVFMNALVIWARRNVPRINKKATNFVFIVSLLLIIPALYRVSIMSQSTTSYYSSEPSAQNHLSSKVIFYLINVLPEWTAVLICASINVRQLFQTGLKGDSRWRDETPKEKEKRLMKEKKKEEKRWMKEKEKELKKGDGLVSTPVISMLSRGRYATPLISS